MLSHISCRILHILALQILGVLNPKLYPNFYPCFTAHQGGKFGMVITTDPKVIGQNVLNFGTIFEFLLWKNCWEPLSLISHALASLAHSFSRACRPKNFWRQHPNFLRHQNGPKIFKGGSPTLSEVCCVSCHISNHLSHFNGDRPRELKTYQAARCHK